MFRSSSPTYSDTDYTMRETTTTRTSPLHFLYPHLTTTPTYSHSYTASSSTTAASKSNKAAKQKRRRTPDHDDISRLLDPSYLPPSSSSRSGVYVDHTGEVHDPDYRHFPLVASSTSHGSHHHPHQHHAHGTTNHGHHNHNHNHHHNVGKRQTGGMTRGRTSPRPQFDWELAVDECALDDEYPPEEEEHIPNNQRYGYTASHRSFSSATSATLSPVIAVRRPRESSFSTANTSPTWYPSPTMTVSTLPTSYEREDTLEDDRDKEKESPVAGKKDEKKKRRMLSKGDKEKERMALKVTSDEENRTRTSFDHALPSMVEEDFAPAAHRDEEEDEDEDEMILGRHQDYVPTCGQSLKRSWQAFALRFRFGVFRAQRRMMRRVHSIM